VHICHLIIREAQDPVAASDYPIELIISVIEREMELGKLVKFFVITVKGVELFPTLVIGGAGSHEQEAVGIIIGFSWRSIEVGIDETRVYNKGVPRFADGGALQEGFLWLVW